MRSLSQILRPCAMIVAAVALAAGAFAQFRPVDPYEASVRLLRRATITQRDGSHLLLLGTLRQLSDPSLVPLFKGLARNKDAGIEVHAVLALGELDEKKQIDPFLVRQMKSPESRVLVIDTALASQLLSADAIAELLGWDDLEPMPRLTLLARLMADGKTVDPAGLVRLSENSDLEIAGLAAWLLAQTGNDSALSPYQARVAALSPAARQAHWRMLFLAIGEFRVAAALDWVLRVLKDPELSAEARAEGVRAVLRIDAKRGVEAWRALLGDKPTHTQAVRCADLLLRAGSDIPAGTFDSLPRGDALVDRMADAGRALASNGKGDAAAALIELIKLGHPRTARWGLDIASKLPDDQAARVYAHVITTVEGESRGADERAQMAVNATTRLFKIAPDRAIELLAAAVDDSLTQETMLVGLLDVESSRVGEAARTLRRLGYNRADCLTMILIAKHSPTLAADELAALSQIARGGGKISDAMLAQACWLYLRHANRAADAVAELLRDS